MTKKPVKRKVGRPVSIKDDADRKRKYAVSLTPNQYKTMLKLFEPTATRSSFEQCLMYAIENKLNQ